MSAARSWAGHDSWLLALVLLSVVVVVLLIGWLKVHAFLALMVGSLAVSLSAGQPAQKAIGSFTTGFGRTAGSVGVLILLGAILGRMLADSGGIRQIVGTLTRAVGPRGLPWALTLVAALVGLPVFFEAGFVMLMPLVLQLARQAGYPVLRVGLPVVAGLATVHALVPPHPGPLVAIEAVHASIGLTMVYGLVVAVPTAVVAGPLFTAFAWHRVPARVPEATTAAFTTAARGTEEGGETAARRLPSFPVTLATILLPVALMLLKAVFDSVSVPHGALYAAVEFLGSPVIALLVTVFVSLFTFGYTLGADRRGVQASLARSFPPVAGVLVVVGAGGGYSQALQDAGIDHAIALAAHDLRLSLILLAWLVAALMRVAVGSGTAATVTAAGIVGPVATGLTPSQAALLALALGSGSAFLGHVNDAGFWMFKEYLGLSVGGTLRTWTVLHTLLSLTSLAGILVLDALV
ncbi:gluconate:H+ symporter [Streptomyces sp. UNOC14_S4]|uniref:GntT/GntP/DsdX family permease n=1 Tax=Streptomyces sp. UNOC14_S4 TaxID=2872340 RepID=UPI001E426169|nr:gluconate:H+ symporter [Streptomyces sp. UNOC14_S4]MCC3770657.1 GntP family permease [Streptomyces sp. UNOC14_S4]